MAKLNPVLITSITNDLAELHIICNEMLPHIDSYEIMSWKYPNKFCKDVQIDIENDMYEEAEQYILLLELIIDRLYFIVNIATHILDSLPSLSNIYNLSINGQSTNNVSFGSLISMFWKRLQALLYLNELPLFSAKSDDTKLENVWSQTDYCSFSTCESCHMFIEMMKELIKKTEESATVVQLSSAISTMREITERDVSKITQFTAMQQWIDAVTADVKSLTELSVKLSSKNLLLQENLSKVKKQKENISKKLSDSKSTCSNLEEKFKSSESKMCSLSITHSVMEVKHNSILETVTSLEEMHKKDLFQIVELGKQINKIKSENEKFIYAIKIEHLNKIETLTEQRDHWTKLHTLNQKYTEEIENKFNKLEANYQMLDKTFHNEIEEQRTKYKEYKMNAEEQQNKFMKQKSELENIVEIQKKNYENKLESLEKQLKKLKAELQSSKEREISLVRCPDLNGPLINLPATKLDPIGDMENQLKSNKIRMDILQTQNLSLQRTIDKMRHLSQAHRKNIEK